ncbi:hypothetical protein [uncultured Methylophaga sp.]|uniref:hypothetical protein n=1 Tax=uncultured Methylophaga sp. TaxID=285271 RepID=UPI0026084401|nr:hypothetical protein [uncultured Methylophaga sp.]
MIERDEDTFAALREMAEDIHLVSRNHNDELIGIEYYNNLQVLSTEELDELVTLWQRKKITCRKEKLASQWLVLQVLMLIAFAIYIGWLSGGITGTISSLIGVIAMIKMIEDKRVRIARRNLADASRVYQHLADFQQSQR